MHESVRGVYAHGCPTRVRLEHCDIWDNEGPGVEVEHSANCAFINTEIRENGGPGVAFLDMGSGLFEGSTVWGNSQLGVSV